MQKTSFGMSYETFNLLCYKHQNIVISLELCIYRKLMFVQTTFQHENLDKEKKSTSSTQSKISYNCIGI